MKRSITLLSVFGFALVLAGCVSNSRVQSAMPADAKVLQANGYGRFDGGAGANVNYRWLSAQQSAKLNAYRGLAQQLYYEPLGSNKTVGTQVMSNEVYRIYLDTYLREARATDYRTVSDSLKTTLELKLTPRFYQCMSGDVAEANRCIREDGKLPITRLGYNAAEIKTVNLACGMADCSDQFYVKGFSKQPGAVDGALLDTGFYDVQWMVNTGVRILLNYLIVNGFVNAL
ncbi:hypothetical protein [Methylomonas sp. MgM2]